MASPGAEGMGRGDLANFQLHYYNKLLGILALHFTAENFYIWTAGGSV